MAYSFKTKDDDLTEAVRRVAASQIDTALEEIADPDLPRSQTIHQLRKRCKKLRGLVRLVRPGFDDYSRENAAFRDIARTLSEARDATASLETLDALEARFGGEVDASIFERHRSALEKRREALDDEEISEALSQAQRELQSARKRSEKWNIEGDPEEILAGGMKKTLKRALTAMKTARRSGETDDFHEWRKRVKYHRYHARLLKHAWPDMIHPWIEAADTLGTELGDHHDLAVFIEETLPELKLPAKARKSRAVLEGLMRAEQARLEADSLERGALLLSEPPAALARRFALYWAARPGLAA